MDRLFQVFEAHRFDPLPELSGTLPPQLVRLIQRLCAKAPEDRPEDGETILILQALAKPQE